MFIHIFIIFQPSGTFTDALLYKTHISYFNFYGRCSHTSGTKSFILRRRRTKKSHAPYSLFPRKINADANEHGHRSTGDHQPCLVAIGVLLLLLAAQKRVDLGVELLNCAVVDEAHVGELHAAPEVLLGRVRRRHLDGLLLLELFEGHLVGGRAAPNGAVVSNLLIRVDGQQREREPGLAQRHDLALRAHRFNDRVRADRLGKE